MHSATSSCTVVHTDHPYRQDNTMEYDDFAEDDAGEPEGMPPRELQLVSQSVTAQFELTLDTVLGSRGGEPYTVGDAIIDAAARQLATEAASSTKESYSYRRQVQELVGEQLDAKAAELVEDLWQRQITETDRFGGKSGQPVTLEAWAAQRVEQWLQQSTDSYGGRGTSRLAKAIDDVLDRKLAKQLDEAIAGAKEQALAAVTKVAEEHLAKALRDSIAAAGKAT